MEKPTTVLVVPLFLTICTTLRIGSWVRVSVEFWPTVVGLHSSYLKDLVRRRDLERVWKKDFQVFAIFCWNFCVLVLILLVWYFYGFGFYRCCPFLFFCWYGCFSGIWLIRTDQLGVGWFSGSNVVFLGIVGTSSELGKIFLVLLYSLMGHYVVKFLVWEVTCSIFLWLLLLIFVMEVAIDCSYFSDYEWIMDYFLVWIMNFLLWISGYRVCSKQILVWIRTDLVLFWLIGLLSYWFIGLLHPLW